MATEIDVRWVSAVLLNDGWHIVQPGSFTVEEYELIDEHGPVAEERGFAFIKQDQLTRATQHYTGPLGSVLGLRYDLPTELVTDE